MYHGTDQKDEIVSTGFLSPNSYFGCTLRNGEPPYQSPFGRDILFIRAKDILALFQDPRLNLDRTTPQDRDGRVNVYNTLNLTEGPANVRGQLDISGNKYLQLRRNGSCMVMKRDLGEVDGDGRDIYYWTNIMVAKKIPLGEVEHHWG